MRTNISSSTSLCDHKTKNFKVKINLELTVHRDTDVQGHGKPIYRHKCQERLLISMGLSHK